MFSFLNNSKTNIPTFKHRLKFEFCLLYYNIIKKLHYFMQLTQCNNFLDSPSHDELFRDNCIPTEVATKFKYSFLQKVAISGCNKKATLIIEKITNARRVYLMNLQSCKLVLCGFIS